MARADDTDLNQHRSRPHQSTPIRLRGCDRADSWCRRTARSSEILRRHHCAWIQRSDGGALQNGAPQDDSSRSRAGSYLVLAKSRYVYLICASSLPYREAQKRCVLLRLGAKGKVCFGCDLEELPLACHPTRPTRGSCRRNKEGCLSCDYYSSDCYFQEHRKKGVE